MTKKEKNRSTFNSRLPMIVGFGTVIFMAGGFAVWSALAQIDGAVVASGQIVVEQNRQVVQHLDGGVVEEIYVREGDKVAQGDVLIKLDADLLVSELKVLETELFELMARRGRLEAERDNADEIVFDPLLLEAAKINPDIAELAEGQRRLFLARKETLEKAVVQLRNQRQQLEKQISGITAQIAAANQQLDLIEEETTAQQTLMDKGLAQRSRLSALQRERARLAGSIGDLTSRSAQAEERIAALEIEQLQYEANRREQAISILRDLQFNELERLERRVSLKRQLDRLEVRAPVSGIVYNQRVFGRETVIRPADPILYLVPQGRPLVIEAKVAPMHVNDVFTHQEVMLRFPAFDMRETPDLFGLVTKVSADVFSDQETGRPYYRVEVIIQQEELSKLNEDQALVPGMPVDTFFRTGDHTPIEYLVSPIATYFDKALRDGG